MADLLSELPVPLDDQIAAVQRELAMRRQVYPRRVAAGRMTQAEADLEVRAMDAVLETLRQSVWALRAATGPQGQPVRALDANDPLAGLSPPVLAEARQIIASRNGSAIDLQTRFKWHRVHAIRIAAALRDEQAAAQHGEKVA